LNPGLAQAVCIALFLVGAAPQQAANVSTPPRPIRALQLSPDHIDFGSQSVGAKSQPQIATLRNTSPNTVTVRDITASGIDFVESDTCQNALAPGQQCNITVSFTPAIAGPRLGTVIITDSEPATLFLVLSGTGN